MKASGFTSADWVQAQFHKYGINIRKVDENHVALSFDEVTSLYDLDEVIEIFCNLKTSKSNKSFVQFEDYEEKIYKPVPAAIARTSDFMT